MAAVRDGRAVLDVQSMANKSRVRAYVSRLNVLAGACPMKTSSLFDTTPRFGDAGYDPALDQVRLTKKLGWILA